MTLVAHLTELRMRVGRSLLFVLLGTALAFWWYEHGLGDFVRAPYAACPTTSTTAMPTVGAGS